MFDRVQKSRVLTQEEVSFPELSELTKVVMASIARAQFPTVEKKACRPIALYKFSI